MSGIGSEVRIGASGRADDPELAMALLSNAFELWFEPEIKRRQEAGTLPTPFELWAAQVLLELDKSPWFDSTRRL